MKISIHEKVPMSAVAYYRSIGPFSYLKKLNKNIEVAIPGQISWDNIIGSDIFYMQRPHLVSDLKALDIAKDFNIPIVVDYDDCLHEIPQDNPAHEDFSKENTLKIIEESIKIADAVTVSTPFLKEYYSKFNKNIHVIENAHNDYQYPFEFVKDGHYNTVNWRGSATHRNDLLSVSEQLWGVSERQKDWSFMFIGQNPWYITEKMTNAYNIKECDITTYNKFIKDLKAAVQIVPLLDNKFNRAKSNIGWLEGTYAGSCTVCPSIPEFEKPGCINYSEEKENFGYLLEKAMKSKTFRKENYEKSFEYIKDNLMLSDINKKRIEVMESLINER